MKAGRAKIGIFQKLRIKNLRRGVSEVRFRKTRLLHLGNVEKPPDPQFFAQRAPEGQFKGALSYLLLHSCLCWAVSAQKYLAAPEI